MLTCVQITRAYKILFASSREQGPSPF